MSEIIDNREERIRTLKGVIRELHEGASPETVRARLEKLVRQCDAGEIAAMEQQLINEGVPVEQIMGMCDLHSQVVSGLLVEREAAPVVSGHPVDVFRRENTALLETSEQLHKTLTNLAASGNEPAVTFLDLEEDVLDVSFGRSRELVSRSHSPL